MRRLCLILIVCAGLTVPAQEFAIPPEMGYVNVKDAGAVGDGKTDDTKVLQAVFGAGKTNRHPKYDTARQIYLPNGTYLISDTIQWGDKKKDVRGESRAGVVLRLQDNCPGFQNPKKPKAVLNNQFGHAGQNFFQRLRHVTVDIGRGNPGAIGIHFHTNNGGGVRNVVIRSSDPQQAGAIGLFMPKWPGPGYTCDLLIDGFDTGIDIRSDQYSWAFENITLTNQRRVGLINNGNSVGIRRLTSKNRVPAVINNSKWASMALVDSRLAGGDSKQSAVINRKGAVLFARDIAVEGYGQALSNDSGTRKDVAGNRIEEYASHPVQALFDGAGKALSLPVEQPPVIPPGDPKEWVDVTKFGAKSTSWQEKFDSGPAIQKAIDSGAEYVVIPDGFYMSYQSIQVRGNLRRLFTLGSQLIFRKPVPAFVIADGKPEAVYVNCRSTYGNAASWTFHHASRRTLVCGGGGSYYNSVPGGKVFMTDFCAVPLVFDRQKVWIRGLNTESYEHNPHVQNFGSDLWVLLHKTEKDRTAIGTYDGGRTELLGGLLYKNRKPLPEAPAFLFRNGYGTLAYRSKWHSYKIQVRETRGDETREVAVKQLGTPQMQMPLYKSLPAGVVVPRQYNLNPGTPVEVLNVYCRTRTAAPTAVLVYAPADGAERTAAMTRDKYGTFNGTIPATHTNGRISFVVKVTDGKEVLTSAPQEILPDTSPPVLPADPKIVVHKKWGRLLSWQPAADESRVREYRLCRGATRDEAQQNTWKVVGAMVLHVPLRKPKRGEVLGVQPIDIAGKAGAVRWCRTP